MLTGLFSMLQGMISRGKVTNTRIGPRTLLQITGLDGQTQQVVELLLPPGYSARPVAGADLLLLQVMGQADHVVALGGDSAGAAITDLAPGEFGMTDGAQRVVFRIGQYLELTSPTKVRVVSPRFVAGLILQHDICIRAAPILHRLMFAQTAETIARIIAALYTEALGLSDAVRGAFDLSGLPAGLRAGHRYDDGPWNCDWTARRHW